MTSFTETFGGDTINPAYLSYAAFVITSDTEFQWPLEAETGSNVIAAKINITANPGLSIIFPDATLVSVGQDVLVYNQGLNTFTVKNNSGTVIGSVASGQSWYFYLTDNTTTGGTWLSVQFGVGVSSATAAALAGAGLNAVANTLNQNLVTTSIATNYTILTSDRATVLRNSGGSVVWTFAQAGSGAGQLPSGWFVYVINAGGGNVTLTPFAGQLIDGNATKIVAPTDSCMVFSDGSALWTLGFGQSLSSTVTGASIALSTPGTVTLNATQIAAQVQDYSGTLLGDVIVNYGTGVGYWFVWNNTTAAHSLTARVNAADVGVIVPQGNFTILRSNGSNMQVAFTAATGSVSLINTTSGEITGGPITSTGTLGLATTGVVAGSYGAAGQTLVETVDTKGRTTSLTATGIVISLGQVSAFSSATLAGQLTDETGTPGGVVVFSNAPTITSAVLTTPAIATITNGTGTLTLPINANDTLVGRATTDTLTNKTIDGAANTITDVSLSVGVTGTLPIANGGTSVTSFAHSVGLPGYQTLINGIIFQWGTVSVAPFGTATVTYSIAFPSGGANSIQLTPATASSAGAPQSYVTPLSGTQFQVHNPDGVVTMTYFWMAVGY